MKAAVAQQPVSVSLYASETSFSLYKDGIYDPDFCSTRPNHATLVVGYGKEADKEYWIMKNSWGLNWGESGYMRILIKEGVGICGIQYSPVYPTLKE